MTKKQFISHCAGLGIECRYSGAHRTMYVSSTKGLGTHFRVSCPFKVSENLADTGRKTRNL